MEFDQGLAVKVIGIEDLIVDRLNSCVHWKYETDCEWTSYLLKKFEKELDLMYLMERATTEHVVEKLKGLMDK